MKQTIPRGARRFVVAATLLVATTSVAQTMSDTLSARYESGSIATVEMAQKALDEVGAERKVVESTYLAEDSRCYSRFFTTPCQEQARERRRHALEQLRQIELEAHTLQRRTRASVRDKELAQKQKEDAADALVREKEAAEKAAQAKAVTPGPAPTAAEVQAEQKKRAANVAAYEKKQREAAVRLRERAVKSAP